MIAMTHSDDPIRLGVLDNDSLALGMLTTLFKGRTNTQILWAAQSPAAVVQLCMNPATRPEVLLVDIGLEGISGIEVCRRIRSFCDSIRMIGITAYTPGTYEREATQAGMELVLGKEDFPAVIDAITHPSVRTDPQLPYHHDENTPGLSPRELEVMYYYAQGKSTKEIMQMLNVSKSTLSSYEIRATHKLNAHNRTEALAICASMHLFG